MNIIGQIIEHFGTKANLARELKVFPQSLTRWCVFGFPASKAIDIERLTKGKFKAVDIPLYSKTPLADRNDKSKAA